MNKHYLNFCSRIRIASSVSKTLISLRKNNFSSQENQEPDDMKAFYNAIRNKLDKIREDENPNPNPVKYRRIWYLKNTIAWTLSSLVLYSNGIVKY